MIYFIAGLVLVFGAVIFFGAPYLPTLNSQAQTALDMLGLKPDQTLLELGSGDGRVARLAAKRGVNVIGYELNPILVIVSKAVTWRYRKRVKIIWGNYWSREWPKADAIFVFLIDRYMRKLNKKIGQYPHRPIKLASCAFKIPGKKPARQKNGILLYIYK